MSERKNYHRNHDPWNQGYPFDVDPIISNDVISEQVGHTHHKNHLQYLTRKKRKRDLKFYTI
jgi:hypothetical protein